MPDKIVPPSNQPQNPDFEAELPLPINNQPIRQEPASGEDATLDLVRKKLADTYENEPDLVEEETSLENTKPAKIGSRHQDFLQGLAQSGKSLPEAQADWHEYYSGLTDEDKQQVWQEFYAQHGEASTYKKQEDEAKHGRPHPAAFKPASRQRAKVSHALKHATRQAQDTLAGAKQLSPKNGLRSLGFGLAIGSVVIVIFLFSFFNERFIAPFIQPSRTAINVSIISGGAVSKDPELIIPKINLEVPVVYDVTSTADGPVQAGLNRGVVHYADTAEPGQDGNAVFIGHSSDNIFNPGKYKFAFVLLDRLQIGDTFYVQKDGKRYVYQVYKRTVVPPTNTSVLGPQDQTATASLITCDPPGTSANRLVVVGKQISPDVSANSAASAQNQAAVADTTVIPGNAPSLWSRFYNWLTN